MIVLADSPDSIIHITDNEQLNFNKTNTVDTFHEEHHYSGKVLSIQNVLS